MNTVTINQPIKAFPPALHVHQALRFAAYYCAKTGVASSWDRRLTLVPESTTEAHVETPRADTRLRQQLESLPVYKPWFIVGVSLLQVIGLVVELSLGGVTYVRFTPKLSYESTGYVM